MPLLPPLQFLLPLPGTLRTCLFALLGVLAPGQACAQAPAGYPPAYAETIAAARKEGKVIVHATTDVSAAAPLNRAFEAMYPGIKVEYRELDSPELYRRFIAEKTAQRPTADVLWSSAMDLQQKLVNDGHAQMYSSPEAAGLPEWAVWRNEAYGTTFEPVVFIYNERLLRANEVPQTHADFARVLKESPDRFKAR